MNDAIWHIGIDAGGTGTTLRAERASGGDGVCLEGPGANLQRLGAEGVCDVLAALVERLLDEQGGRVGALAAGISGAGRPHEQRAVREGLARRLGPAAPPTLAVVHDGEIALEGAFEGEGGVITITGTGSLVLGRTRDGRLVRAGGWGYLLGDDGSGYALGRAALRAACAHHDGGPRTLLADLLAEREGLANGPALIGRVYAEAWPLQHAAPLALEAAAAGDAVAQHLVGRAAHALARQVGWLAGREDADFEPQAAPIGGLTRDPLYRTALMDAFRDVLPEWHVGPPRHPPVTGALLLARRRAAERG